MRETPLTDLMVELDNLDRQRIRETLKAETPGSSRTVADVDRVYWGKWFRAMRRYSAAVSVDEATVADFSPRDDARRLGI